MNQMTLLMSDEELRAMWLYLQSLPALEQGEKAGCAGGAAAQNLCLDTCYERSC